MRIGVLGGTFNPIHFGHIRMAKRAAREFSLDKCLLMVANDPPHKQVANAVSPEMRLEMTAAALDELGLTPRISASDLEIRDGGVSYTVLTLRRLKEMYPDAELSLIVGADMLMDLPNWREPEEIFKLADIIAVKRRVTKAPASLAAMNEQLRAAADMLRDRFSARVKAASFPTPDISSNMIRERVMNAQPIVDLTPFSVERMIYENALYQPPVIVDIIADLKKRLNRKRFLHSVSAMREAVSLAERFHVDAEKCRLGALLHDCAKISGASYIELAEQRGIEIDEYERVAPSILHAKLGAYEANKRYGIEDADVLRAIENHTVCRRDMTDVEKVVYIADKIEALRDYPGVQGLRGAARRDLNEGMIACMDFNINYLREHNAFMHPGILDAREYLVKNN